MKKTAKILLLVCCAALFLFLLLPFLETQAPSKAGRPDTQAKAEPQIFTSNPLTELVGRIARFFGGKKSAGAAAQPSQTLTAEQVSQTFGEPQSDALYASAQPVSGAQTAGTVSSDAAAYANAYFKNEEGEWVLIQQTAPEGASRGMHEVNVKDNAYDRYVHQERQARFTPVIRTPQTKEVPDSKLARVFNPIKRLFGFGEDSAAAPRHNGNENFATGKLVSSSGLDRNKEKTSTLPKTRPIDWNGFGINPVSSLKPGGTEATKELANIILPDAELKNTAEWLADLKYPNADNDPQIQQEKQNFIDGWIAEKDQQVNEKFAKILEEKAQKDNQNNILSEIIKNTCEAKISSVPAPADRCITNKTQDPVQEYKEQNAQSFYEKTALRLPPAGITVVLHKTDQEIPTEQSIAAEYTEIGEEPPQLSPEQRQALDMYHYMQEHCEGNCYWVATGEGPAQEIQQTVEAAGLVMKGDPLNRHQQYIDGFINEQRKNGLSEEQLQELRQQLESNQTPYTAYTQEDLQQLHQQTLDLLSDRAQPEDASVPFFTQAGSAYQYYNDTGKKHPMFYGEGSATKAGSLQERSAALTDEMADFVNSWKPIIREIKQEAAQEGVTELSAPKIQEILERTKQDIKNFDAGNDLGRTQK